MKWQCIQDASEYPRSFLGDFPGVVFNLVVVRRSSRMGRAKGGKVKRKENAEDGEIERQGWGAGRKEAKIKRK